MSDVGPQVIDRSRSRLGCQVKLTKELDGMVATLPAATRNMYVDGEYTPRLL